MANELVRSLSVMPNVALPEFKLCFSVLPIPKHTILDTSMLEDNIKDMVKNNVEFISSISGLLEVYNQDLRKQMSMITKNFYDAELLNNGELLELIKNSGQFGEDFINNRINSHIRDIQRVLALDESMIESIKNDDIEEVKRRIDYKINILINSRVYNLIRNEICFLENKIFEIKNDTVMALNKKSKSISELNEKIREIRRNTRENIIDTDDEIKKEYRKRNKILKKLKETKIDINSELVQEYLKEKRSIIKKCRNCLGKIDEYYKLKDTIFDDNSIKLDSLKIPEKYYSMRYIPEKDFGINNIKRSIIDIKNRMEKLSPEGKAYSNCRFLLHLEEDRLKRTWYKELKKFRFVFISNKLSSYLINYLSIHKDEYEKEEIANINRFIKFLENLFCNVDLNDNRSFDDKIGDYINDLWNNNTKDMIEEIEKENR